MRNVLLDSGAIIALFASDDKHHERFDELVDSLSAGGLRLLTTWPCVVESSYPISVAIACPTAIALTSCSD